MFTPEKVKELQSSWKSKNTEAQAIIADPNATGEQLRKAETLFNERDQIKADLQRDREDRELAGKLQGRKDAGEAWLNEPSEDPPLSGKGAKVIGTEPAGHRTIERKGGRWETIDEVGAGAFGEKTWDLLKSVEYKRDFALYLRKGQRQVDLRTKTLQEAVDEQGGVLAPAEMIARIIGREPAPFRIRSRVTSVPTGRDQVEMPRLLYAADDTYSTGIRVTATGETPPDNTGDMHKVDDRNLFGTVTIPVHTYMLSAALTRNQAEDSAYPVQSFLEGKFGETTDGLYDNQILNGNGNGNPFGILFGADAANDGTHAQFPQVILSGSAGAVSVDMLDDLQSSLPEQYENENTCWIMSKKSGLRAIRKLKDTANRPLFTTGAQDYGIVGARGRVLLGDPVVCSTFMPDVGASNFPVIYGDPRGYFLVERLGLSIQVLDQTAAKRNMIEIVARLRFGGKPVEPWRLKIGKSNNS